MRGSRDRGRKRRGKLALHPRIADSSTLCSALREYARVRHCRSLLTVEFRSVNEYLDRLRQCSEALDVCGSMGLAYLAAAISDFHVPGGCRSDGIESLPSSLPSSSPSLAAVAAAASAETDTVAAGRAEEESGRGSDGGEGGGGGGGGCEAQCTSIRTALFR